MSVPQHMKIHSRCYFCNLACLNKRSLLVRLPPRVPILTNKNVRVCGSSRRPAHEQRPAFTGQDHVTRFARFSLSNCQRIAVGVEVRAPQVCKLGISATCQECRLHHAPEIRWAGVDQAPRFIGRKITDHWLFNPSKGFDFAPNRVRSDTPTMESAVQRSL